MTLTTFDTKYSQAITQKGGFIYAYLSSLADITWTTTKFDETKAYLDGGMVWLMGTDLDFVITTMTLIKTTSEIQSGGGFYL